MRFAFIPLDADVLTNREPLWRNVLGLRPEGAVREASDQIGYLVAGIGLRGLISRVIAPVAVSDPNEGVVAWAIGLASEACLLPLSPSPDGFDNEPEWLVLRVVDHVAYHFETAPDLDGALAASCKAIATGRLERQAIFTGQSPVRT